MHFLLLFLILVGFANTTTTCENNEELVDSWFADYYDITNCKTMFDMLYMNDMSCRNDLSVLTAFGMTLIPIEEGTTGREVCCAYCEPFFQEEQEKSVQEEQEKSVQEEQEKSVSGDCHHRCPPDKPIKIKYMCYDNYYEKVCGLCGAPDVDEIEKCMVDCVNTCPANTVPVGPMLCLDKNIRKMCGKCGSPAGVPYCTGADTENEIGAHIDSRANAINWVLFLFLMALVSAAGYSLGGYKANNEQMSIMTKDKHIELANDYNTLHI